jgi:drug/metabolite transporter (DMT)-like permease
MLGEKINFIRVASLVLGAGGILLVSTNDIAHASFDHRLLLGNIAIFLGAAGSAFYNTYSKDLLTKYGELELLIGSYSVGVVACAIISCTTEPRPFYRLTGYSGTIWIAVVFLGVVSWGLAMVLWMWVLNRLEVSQISASIYLLPLLGLLLSVATVHEHITGKQIVGGALTLSGTALLTFLESRRQTRPDTTCTGETI